MSGQIKHICVVADQYPTKTDPVFMFIDQLMRALARQGVAVSVIAPQSLTKCLLRGAESHPKYRKLSFGDGFVEVFQPYEISFGRHLRFVQRISKKFAVKRSYRLLKDKPDALYGHFWHSANCLLDIAVDHKLPLFVACGEGDNAIEEMLANLSPSRKQMLVNAVKGVISVSSANKDICIRYGLAKEEDITVLPNCVDDSLFKPADASETRAGLGLAEDDFVISFTGAFIKRKGSAVLSAAVDKLADDKIKLIFAGKALDGDDFTPTCDGIVYIGSTEHDNLPNLLNASDVFVLPTLKEGCCNAIVEALACGLPVISSDYSFNDDILNGFNSLRVEPTSVDEVAEAIHTLQHDKSLYGRMKEYCLLHAGEHSIDARAKNIISFLNEKINK